MDIYPSNSPVYYYNSRDKSTYLSRDIVSNSVYGNENPLIVTTGISQAYASQRRPLDIPIKKSAYDNKLIRSINGNIPV